MFLYCTISPRLSSGSRADVALKDCEAAAVALGLPFTAMDVENYGTAFPSGCFYAREGAFPVETYGSTYPSWRAGLLFNLVPQAHGASCGTDGNPCICGAVLGGIFGSIFLAEYFVLDRLFLLAEYFVLKYSWLAEYFVLKYPY